MFGIGIISNMVFEITSKESAHMFLSLYSLLSKCKGAAAEYERSCGCFCPLYMKRSRVQPLSMKARAPPQICGRHCMITANSNGDENAHASSFNKVTMLRVVDEKESKSRLKESNSGNTVHSSRLKEVLWNRGLTEGMRARICSK